MSNSSTGQEPRIPQGEGESADRLVYVVPQNALGTPFEQGISLRDLFSDIWHRKWLIVAVTSAFALGSVAYAFLAQEWYRSEVLMAPADSNATPSIAGQLGGLAVLAGVEVGGKGSAESLAVLKSREFLGRFIEEYDLMPVLFEERWDASQGVWILRGSEAAPDIREAVKLFQQEILKIQEERDTGLVNVAVEWKDPALAADWASTLVRRLNDRLRERALREAEANVAFLQSELGSTSVVTLQQSIGRLLESEMQKLMLARGNEEFAFRVVDPAQVPQQRVRPRRARVVIIGTIFGAMFSGLAILVLHVIRVGKSDADLAKTN